MCLFITLEKRFQLFVKFLLQFFDVQPKIFAVLDCFYFFLFLENISSRKKTTGQPGCSLDSA